jgi:hypothetical protein
MTRRRKANQLRAQRALAALNAYLDVSDNNDKPEIYCDLLTDLGHLCDSERIDFQRLIDMALIHWSCERTEVPR